MSYQYSNLDRNNIAWMEKDNSCATLSDIHLFTGSLRGLQPCELNLKYPITAVAGQNGSGKSTLLAIAACAYHNSPTGYKPIGRANNYYTFSDFFIQSRDETPPDGIEIEYQFRYNNWRGGEPGLGWQIRRKNLGGKWNNYNRRVIRNVIYLGIQRIVPHNERSTHKSYRVYFENDSLEENNRKRICEIAGRVLGKTYDTFEKHIHSKYSLPIVSSSRIRYSGFNMGAGESTVFEILSSLFESGKGSLLIIDEIELGLHESAQIRFVEELKLLCKELHCQIICSTHSHVVLGCLPPEGRFFLETHENRTTVTAGISPDFACGNLRDSNSGELDIFVEDSVASMILQLGLPYEFRRRINVRPIGSSEAVIRVLSSRYLEKNDTCLCVLDGDKRNEHTKAKDRIRRYIETNFRESESELHSWIDQRVTYLPSENHPEGWLIERCLRISDKSQLVSKWGINDVYVVETALEQAKRAEAHKEFFTLSSSIQLSMDQVIADVIRFVTSFEPDALKHTLEKIDELIP